jgi:hypothetical protein
MRGPVAISTFHEYMLEATSALRLGLNYHKRFERLPAENGSDLSGYYAAMNCRYAFLMIANSLEAGANALLLSKNFPNDYYQELEKLNTLLKFRLFCNLKGQQLDSGNVLYANAKDIISCRNEFVHPKPRRVEYTVNEDTSTVSYDIKKTKNREYPHYFTEILPEHTLSALGDALAFISWVCFDICGFEIEDGALLLGVGSYGSTGDIDVIEMDKNIKFDKRSFGRVR